MTAEQDGLDLAGVMVEHRAVPAYTYDHGKRVEALDEEGQPFAWCAADCQDEDGVSEAWPCEKYRLAALALDLRGKVARVLMIAYQSDDGSEYEHDHGRLDGYPECPACWAADIRTALADQPEQINPYGRSADL